MILDERTPRRRAYALFIGAALIGLFALTWATGRGIGLQPDSAFYLDCAKHLRAGDGYVTTVQDYLKPISLGQYLEETRTAGFVRPRPEVVFPPLYSIALAAVSAAGPDAEAAGRGLGFLLFGANILLACLLVYRATGPSPLPALAAAVLMFGSESMLTLHAGALSEPLFIFLGLTGLAGLSSYIGGGRVSRLIFGSLAVGLAFLTRYAGGALVASGVLGLLVLGKAPVRKRLAAAAACLALSCLPTAAFILRNIAAAGEATNRVPTLYASSPRGFLPDFLTTVSSWVFPNVRKVLEFQVHRDILSIVSLVLLGALVLAVIRLARRAARGSSAPPAPGGGSTALLALTLPVYFIYILFSALFVDPEIPLDYRMLSPIFVVGLICCLIVLGRGGARRLQSGRFRAFLAAAAILYLAGYAAIGAAWIVRFHAQGGGYNNTEWTSEDMKAAFTRIAAETKATPLLTNDNAAVYFRGGRDSYFVPFARRLDRLAGLKAELGTGPVLLLYFKTAMHVVRDEAEAGLSSDRIERGLAEGLSAEVLLRRPTVTLFRVNGP